MPDIPADAQRSPDGNYWWDGTQWQLIDQSDAGASPSPDTSSVPASAPASTAIPADAQRSADGNYWWDGTQWQLIDQSAAGPGAGSDQSAGPGQQISGDQFVSMLEAAQSGVVEG